MPNQIEIPGATEEVAPIEEAAEEDAEIGGEVVLDLELPDKEAVATATPVVTQSLIVPKPVPTEKAPKGKKLFHIGRTNIMHDKKLYASGGIIALNAKEAEHLNKFITPI